ncbi:phosphoribosyltransferase [soil metagenome]
MGRLFSDRRDAGRRLAKELDAYRQEANVLVLALPRGGVPVAFEVALALNAPLDVFLVRKLGVPGREELAMGAIAAGGIRIVNQGVVRALRISEERIAAVADVEMRELQRRDQEYRGALPPPDVSDKTVILIDDGLATGSTMRAAAAAVSARRPARLLVAVPVGARESCEALLDMVDEVVCVETPDPFYGVGMWYEDFPQTTDDEVRALLQRSREIAFGGPHTGTGNAESISPDDTKR